MPSEMVIVEDSLSGVKAGLASGARVLAVATPMTHKQLHESGLLDGKYIVDGPENLQAKMGNLLNQA